jgi:C4-dicarboxylate-specific signal transduction histidine kinase
MSRLPGDLPPETVLEREAFHTMRIRSHLAVPLFSAGSLWGVIALSSSLQRLWMVEDIQRVRVMGVALTHELNQPLTAIRANAQATQRLLARGVPVDELGDVLQDIVGDATRAADLILRLANLFRHRELERIPVDVNQPVQHHETRRSRYGAGHQSCHRRGA